MSGRDPDAILREVGEDLTAAWRRPPRRSRAIGWRRAAAVGVAMLALVPTALATRDAVWAPEPARVPMRDDPGAVKPQHEGAQVYVADGVDRGVNWQLSASSCQYGAVRAVGVFLSVPGGGGGARCDVASRLPGMGVSPDVLAQRLVQTYFDPVADRTWAFGAVPASTRTVDVTTAGGHAIAPATVADPDAVARGSLPAGMRVFVAALDGARDVPLVEARSASGAAVLVCREGRCTTPNTEGRP